MRIFKVIGIALLATTLLWADVYLDEVDFESGMPSGWTMGDGNNDGVTWTTGQTSGLNNFYEPSTSNYAYFDDGDAPGTSPAGDDTLYSPVYALDTLYPLSDLRIHFSYGIYSDYGNPPINLIFMIKIKQEGAWQDWYVVTQFTPNHTGGYSYTLPDEIEAVQFAWVFRETDGVANAGAAGIDNIELYVRYPSLHPVDIVWNDNGDLIPNEEGDGSASNPVNLVFNMVNVGDTSSDSLYLVFDCNDYSGNICSHIHHLNDSLNIGMLNTYDTAIATLQLYLDPYPSVDTFEVGFDVYEGTTYRQGVFKTFIVKPQYIDTTPLYTFYDNTDDHYQEAPEFLWHELNPSSGGEGTLFQLTEGSSNTYGYLNLPAPFYYAGALYDTITISQYGYVMFGMRNATYTDNHAGFPMGTHYPMFAPFWESMNFDGTYGSPHGIYTYVSSDSVVIEWSGISSTYDSDTMSFEMILRYNDPQNPEDDEILVQYLNNPPSRLENASVGYQNADGSEGYNLVYRGSPSVSVYPIGANRAIRFIPVPAPPPDFSLTGFNWDDGEDGMPDTDGDSNVNYSVSVHNGGGTGFNVIANLTCMDAGSGVCSHITIIRAADTIPTIEEDRDTTFHFTLYLSQGAPQHAIFYLKTTIHYGTDSIAFVDTLRVEPAHNIPHGAGYYALQNNDSQYQMPDDSFVELDPSLGGDGTLLWLSTGDDDYNSIDLPESFSYMQNIFARLWVSTNGWASLGSDPGLSAYSNENLPNNDGISSMLAVLWDDLMFIDYGNNGGIYYKYDSQQRRLIVEWSKATKYNASISPVSFELILFYGSVDNQDALSFIYKDTIPSEIVNSATVGIENEYEDSALVALYNGTYSDGFSPLVAGHFIYFTRELVGVNENPRQKDISPILYFDMHSKNLVFNVRNDAEVNMRVYDILGREAISESFRTRGGLEVNLSKLQHGVYIIKAEVGDKHLTRKIVIR